MTDFEDLDALYKDARRQQFAQAKLRAAGAKPPVPLPSNKYRDPENWMRKRGVAVIHAETETLLGNFVEWTHRTEANCRKLVREKELMTVEAVERVSGSWWIAAEHRPEPRQEWHTKREAMLHLHLGKLCIHSPACSVIVWLSYGGIARVELAADTTFAQEDEKQEQLVFLPAGTNVLSEMSLDSKIALRVALGAEA